MNQMLQDPEVRHSPEPPTPPTQHRRFAKPQRVAFVQSSWHREVVEECRIAFLGEIEARGIAPAQVDLFEVPGSFEIPLHAQILAKTRRYTAIVAAGLVVDGGIYRHEFVAQAVISGIVQVGLDTGIPVLSAVLTPIHFHEHEAHLNFFTEHMLVKGKELAQSCAAVLKTLESIPSA